MKNPAHLYEVSFFSALWMVFPESWKRRAADFYAHHCTLGLIVPNIHCTYHIYYQNVLVLCISIKVRSLVCILLSLQQVNVEKYVNQMGKMCN